MYSHEESMRIYYLLPTTLCSCCFLRVLPSQFHQLSQPPKLTEVGCSIWDLSSCFQIQKSFQRECQVYWGVTLEFITQLTFARENTVRQSCCSIIKNSWLPCFVQFWGWLFLESKSGASFLSWLKEEIPTIIYGQKKYFKGNTWWILWGYIN